MQDSKTCHLVPTGPKNKSRYIQGSSIHANLQSSCIHVLPKSNEKNIFRRIQGRQCHKPRKLGVGMAVCMQDATYKDYIRPHLFVHDWRHQSSGCALRLLGNCIVHLKKWCKDGVINPRRACAVRVTVVVLCVCVCLSVCL